MKEQMLKFIKENDRSIRIFIFIFILGLASGILCFKYINIASNNEFIDSFNKTLQIINNENFKGISIFSNGIYNIFITYLVIIISVITIITPVILFGMYFVKGFSTGIFISVLLNIFGFSKGLLLTVSMSIIPSLLVITCLIFLGIKTIDFNNFILEKNNSNTILKQIIVYAMYFILTIPVMLLSVVIEQLSLPLFIN